MGFFSFITQDTNEPIYNAHSGRDMGTVYIHDDKGNILEASHYDGYGNFNGENFFLLIAQMNRKRKINLEDELAVEKAIDRGHELFYSPRKDTKFPNITRNREWVWRNEAPLEDDNQGFFYQEESEIAA